MESSSKKEDESDDSEPVDWSLMFSQILRSYSGMKIEDILHMSYPQFKALYRMIYEPKSFGLVIPYMGSIDDNKTKEIKTTGNEVDSKEGILQMVANANAIWKQ